VITAGVDLPDEALAAEVAAGLAQVEEGLRDAARADHEVLTQASAHLLEAGGKRLRPLLVLLAAQFGDPSDKRVVPAAVAVELTHLATLYHDDVMDEADIRRDTPSANQRWNNTIAILTGDFLFARASSILADLGAEAIRIQAQTFSRLVTGQVTETVGPRPGEDPFEHYLSVITEKTGSLIATAGRFGAMFSGAPAGVAEKIMNICASLGVAYQISDDVLDVASDRVQSGKTPGTDLREGVPTLPMLHAVAMAGPGDARLVELLSKGQLSDPEEIAEALRLLRAHPAMDRAMADVRDWVQRARDDIAGLPDVPARAAFEAFCDFVIERAG
jgi:heptaprenyl diphosphate synthase